MKRIIFILFAFILTPVFAKTSFFDNYVCQNWSSFGNLSGATATDILQTQDGYINIGTYEGLIRFDGVEFTKVRRAKDNEISFASVRVIFQDSKGNVWIGSNDDGVQKLSTVDKKSYSTKNGLMNNSVRAICEDKRGNIWIGTASGVVYITPQGRMITPQFEAGSIPKGIISRHLFCDTAGRVWLTTESTCGLYYFADGIFRRLTELDQFGEYYVTAINQDLLGNIWVSISDCGMVRISNGNLSVVKTDTILDTTPVNSIYPERNGTLWFGTEKGLVVYSNGEYFQYKGNTLETSTINRITGDREGNIWFATDRNGIAKLTHGKFSVTKTQGTVNAICEDTEGCVWVGTDTGLICLQNEHEIQNALTEYTKGIRIRHIANALNGDLLVSCYKKPGQLRYNFKTKKITSWTTDNGLSGNKVRVALETSPGEVYVGTTTGLSIIHPDGKITTMNQQDGFDNEYIMCIYKDRKDCVWIGTDGGGVYVMERGRIVAHFSTNDGLSGNVIFKISQDVNDSYWICTSGGISRGMYYNEENCSFKTIDNFNSDSGLGTDSVFQALFDSTGNVWMTSNHGIASALFEEFSSLEKNAIINTKFFNNNDGLDSKGPTSTSLNCIDHFGRIWFAMVDGYALYDPVKAYETQVVPLVNVETISVDNVEYKASPNQAIVLKPGTKRVDIKFTGLSFDAPERINFSYKLSGFDEDFSMPSHIRTVSYTNIKPGRHVFQVHAINGTNQISETAETILFIQKPYLHQRPLFWIAVVLCFFAIVVFIFFLREKQMKKVNAMLENMVKIKTADLEAEKNKSDSLLRAILPDKIADKLKDTGVQSIGENFEDATVLFSDIENFTKITSGIPASEIVDALNNLFCRFDERAKSMGVEKIKTIGDAYMAACGIPTPNHNHAKIMIDFARGMYQDLEEYNKTAKIKFNIRIGLNCGPVTAGVIGRSKFIYDVWGNTVNVASRMETAGTPGKIRITENVRQHLLHTNLSFSEPILCDVKGKGMMTTYDLM